MRCHLSISTVTRGVKSSTHEVGRATSPTAPTSGNSSTHMSEAACDNGTALHFDDAPSTAPSAEGSMGQYQLWTVETWNSLLTSQKVSTTSKISMI
ncbi:hypothetical protein V5799_007473 [Amblyomma americanum]|uniref:Uncharacterized protein n=1 Tax=Amblyomma americanum TaxID=6943 RepID=A0AAQ4FHI2_AMBAM